MPQPRRSQHASLWRQRAKDPDEAPLIRGRRWGLLGRTRNRTLRNNCVILRRLDQGRAQMGESRIERRLAAILAADVVGYSPPDGSGRAWHIRTYSNTS